MGYFDLTGQTAVVTGAATGIGEAVARRLAGAGARVGVADIQLDGATAVAGSIAAANQGRAFPLQMDVTDPKAVAAAVNDAIELTGRLDVLVNNAGVAGKVAPLTEQSDEDWDRVLRVNATGVFNCCRAVIPLMRERKYGRIVNVASVAGKEGNPNMTGYSASKAAVIAFTKSLAKEVALDGICVNAVAPAVVRTRILDDVTPEQIDYMTSRIPMRRTGTPEEIAAVVHYLSSPDCSFVTGQCHDASGGRATY
ncbi:MAG: SDR family oxidoreductase [bacterium]|nr:SDR family oxidoreductase [bacterium]